MLGSDKVELLNNSAVIYFKTDQEANKMKEKVEYIKLGKSCLKEAPGYSLQVR
jgi:hypothetical protein